MRESDAIACGLSVVRRSRRAEKECVDCLCYVSIYTKRRRCECCQRIHDRLTNALR